MGLCQQRQDAAEPQDHSAAQAHGDAAQGGRERSRQTLVRNRKILEINWSRSGGCPGCATGRSCTCLTRCALCRDSALGASIAEPTLPERGQEGWIDKHPYRQKFLIATESLARAGSDLVHHGFTSATITRLLVPLAGRKAGEARGLLASLMGAESPEPAAPSGLHVPG